MEFVNKNRSPSLCVYILYIWLVVSTPLKIWKSVGIIIPNMWKHVPNHQPDRYIYIYILYIYISCLQNKIDNISIIIMCNYVCYIYYIIHNYHGHLWHTVTSHWRSFSIFVETEEASWNKRLEHWKHANYTILSGNWHSYGKWSI